MSKRYDVVVIGSGPGGYRAAIMGALRGLAVAIVERGQWGGCCLNRGCVPKKDWYHSARLIAGDADLRARGIDGRLRGDLARAWSHQRGVVERVRASYVDYMRRLKITVVEGHGRLDGPNRVRILRDGALADTLDARHVILATGAAPVWPQELTPVRDRILTTDMLFDHPPPPGARVAIVGSGVVATELAFILKLLGKEVTWLARSRPLHRISFTPHAVSTLMRQCERHGVHVRDARIARARVDDAGVMLHLEDGALVETDWALLGTGRRPYTDSLGLESAGITTNADGFVERNARLQTAAPNVYAIGDCASPRMTSNHALADGTVAVHNILTGNTREQDEQWIPMVVYSAVELARIGMDDESAEDAGLEPAIGFAAFDTSPAALGEEDTAGFVRLIGDMDSGALVGGEIVGGEAGELIHLLSLAPDRDTALRWLARGTYNHPARAEELLNATETMAHKWNLRDEIFGET
ncbi:MAG: NAD(P)/FAD-dependent oxidoreductase [Gammaproteobacteria bacterium]|nr:NAD(P)/FAD-dependent oxidoreductase [Gammaproteobacteria bacterium]NIR82884.1 NAD(P)/FAD-dependent oxidoreductase [Gammaproteobacteria bacterium]NIR89996.1 NAD(P)/FAD-dependent oxidoreductase [Gammaproteobacteria bacterium]NIU03476.1 NAD(P)/FAD-dependent oxidoreductase [Gammaproteobacteria bacterium]NIV50995.1 FAD-dependent oxidoreductase [Gammaproteobacteria bacterium]